MGFHRIPSLRLGNQIGSIFCRFTPPTKPRIENRFGVFVLLKFFHYYYKKHLFIDTEIIEVKNQIVSFAQ